MVAGASDSWAQHLTTLQQQGTITGFVLVTPQGPSEPATGVFAQECAQGVSPAVQALIRPFYELSEPPTTHTLSGHKLHVVQQGDSSYVAIAKQRQLGLLALNVPGGVLLATFGRAAQPTAALAAVQRAWCGGAAHDRGGSCGVPAAGGDGGSGSSSSCVRVGLASS